jgi:NADH:ubiquinone oxidoreductase subunit C
MSVFQNVREQLGTTEQWVESGGVHWLATNGLNVRQVAAVMNEVSARFVTITATELSGEPRFSLEYLWDHAAQLLGFRFDISGNSFESIFDLCEAADWIEREIHEGFDLDFLGREYEPLLLRSGDKPGVNLHEEVK